MNEGWLRFWLFLLRQCSRGSVPEIQIEVAAREAQLSESDISSATEWLRLIGGIEPIPTNELPKLAMHRRQNLLLLRVHAELHAIRVCEPDAVKLQLLARAHDFASQLEETEQDLRRFSAAIQVYAKEARPPYTEASRAAELIGISLEVLNSPESLPSDEEYYAKADFDKLIDLWRHHHSMGNAAGQNRVVARLARLHQDALSHRHEVIERIDRERRSIVKDYERQIAAATQQREELLAATDYVSRSLQLVEVACTTTTEPKSWALPREPIPEAVRHEVWRRDQGRCVECGSQERLEFDHLIPHSKGGSNTARNIRLLCEPCNRAKSDRI